eukprot:3078429-Amphidinium_carterae.2
MNHQRLSHAVLQDNPLRTLLHVTWVALTTQAAGCGETQRDSERERERGREWAGCRTFFLAAASNP